MILSVLALLVAAGICWWVFSVYSFNPPVHADEVHTVTTPDLWHLRVCRYKPKSGEGEPVLMVHGFMSTQFNFALPAGASMADALAEAGYDCWVMELRGNRTSIPPFGHSIGDASMDDHILRDIPATIRYIQKTTGYAKIHWVGHSMGGMLLYAHDAVLGSADLASGTTLGSPIGFQDVPFPRFAGLGLTLRKTSWLALRCVQRLIINICHLFKPQLALIPVNYENMNPILDASNMFSTLDAPPIGVSESLSNALETHKWSVKDETVNVFDHLKDLQVPLFAIFGAGDPFVPVEHAKTFFDQIRNTDKRFMMLSKANGNVADYSHVDLVFGRETKKEVFTPVVEWMAAHPIAQPVVVEEEVAKKMAKPVPAPQPALAADPPKPKRSVADRKTAPIAAVPAAKTATAKKAPAKKAVAAPKPAAKKPVAKKAVAKKAAAKKAAAPPKPAPAEETAPEAKPGKKASTRKYASSKDKF